MAVTSVTLLFGGCGGSGKHASPATIRTRTAPPATTQTRTAPVSPTPAEVRRAAARTARQPGFQAHVSAGIGLPQANGSPLTAAGSGSFDPRSQSGTLKLAVQLPGLLALVGPLPTQVILVGGEAYVQVPTDVAQELSSLPTWLEASTAQLDLSALDPSTVLSQIARDATRHVPDQRAHVTIDSHTGLIRTIVLSYTEPGGYRIHVRLRFTGFQAVPASQPPASTEVGSLSSALHELGL